MARTSIYTSLTAAFWLLLLSCGEEKILHQWSVLDPTAIKAKPTVAVMGMAFDEASKWCFLPQMNALAAQFQKSPSLKCLSTKEVLRLAETPFILPVGETVLKQASGEDTLLDERISSTLEADPRFAAKMDSLRTVLGVELVCLFYNPACRAFNGESDNLCVQLYRCSDAKKVASFYTSSVMRAGNSRDIAATAMATEAAAQLDAWLGGN